MELLHVNAVNPHAGKRRTVRNPHTQRRRTTPYEGLLQGRYYGCEAPRDNFEIHIRSDVLVGDQALTQEELTERKTPGVADDGRHSDSPWETAGCEEILALPKA